MLNLNSTTKEKVGIRVNPVDTTGGAASIDGKASVIILTGAATFAEPTQEEADADTAAGGKGLIGYVVSEDTTGTSTFKISADSDLGEGVETIEDNGTYSYNSPKAVSLGLTADAPIAK